MLAPVTVRTTPARSLPPEGLAGYARDEWNAGTGFLVAEAAALRDRARRPKSGGARIRTEHRKRRYRSFFAPSPPRASRRPTRPDLAVRWTAMIRPVQPLAVFP